MQSLLGKLSFVTACVKPGRIFMLRLLNSLHATAAVHDCELTARHIPGVHNVLADALSRWRTDFAYHELFYESAARLGRQYTFQTVSRDYFNFQVQ